MIKKNRLFTLLMLAGCLGSSIGLVSCSNGSIDDDTVPPPPSQVHTTAQPPDPSYCPLPSQLTKNGLYWLGPDSWLTHTASFSDKIVTFLGAQWQGLNDGKIICIYRGNKGDFAISLQTNNFVACPWGGAWETLRLGKDPSAHPTYVVNCVSTDPADCGFPSTASVWKADKPSMEATAKNAQKDALNATPLSN